MSLNNERRRAGIRDITDPGGGGGGAGGGAGIAAVQLGDAADLSRLRGGASAVRALLPTMRKEVVMRIILMALMLMMLPAQAMARDAFAGTWDAVVTPGEDASAAHQKEFKDVLTFKGDTFVSERCAKQGVKEMKYEENQQYGLAATFKAQGNNEKTKETVTWTGQAAANRIKGEMVIKKPNGDELHFTFQAERRP
jgi:hypothetical protein